MGEAERSVDPTGSRRFICVYAEEIDNTGLINYDQLYAQLYAELEQGRRYWFEDEENARIMQQNLDFQQIYEYVRMTELQDILKQRLSEGQTVILPGIGRFSLRVESIGVDDPKTFNIRRHITRIVCGFLPAGRRIQGRHILYDFCEGVKAVWQTGFKP